MLLGYVLVGLLLLGVLGSIYLVHKGRTSHISVTVEGEHPDIVGNPLDPVDVVKLNWFNMHHNLVAIKEEDGNEAYFIQDKKTKQMVGYILDDLSVRELKQQGGGK